MFINCITSPSACPPLPAAIGRTLKVSFDAEPELNVEVIAFMGDLSSLADNAQHAIAPPDDNGTT